MTDYARGRGSSLGQASAASIGIRRGSFGSGSKADEAVPAGPIADTSVTAFGGATDVTVTGPTGT